MSDKPKLFTVRIEFEAPVLAYDEYDAVEATRDNIRDMIWGFDYWALPMNEKLLSIYKEDIPWPHDKVLVEFPELEDLSCKKVAEKLSENEKK